MSRVSILAAASIEERSLAQPIPNQTRGDTTMQSNTTRAVTAHSNSRRRYPTFWTAVAVAIAVGYASSSLAFAPPDAIGEVHLKLGNITANEVQVGVSGEESPTPAVAKAIIGDSEAVAESSKTKYKVSAFTKPPKPTRQGGEVRTHAEADFAFIAHDPNPVFTGTKYVMLHLKMGAETGWNPDASSASYEVVVCESGEPGYVEYDTSGKPLAAHGPQCGPVVPFHAFGATSSGYYVKWHRRFDQLSYNVQDTGFLAYDELSEGVPVVPGRQYLIKIVADSRGQSFIDFWGTEVYGTAVATVDPVLEPVDPDVWIEFPNLANNPEPIMGDLTPEALAASGLDPQPFLDLGFFDSPSNVPPSNPPPPPPPPSSSDTAPPTTLASATPGANASGWNNAPVTVALTATDNAGGSGVKEVHYSLGGVLTGSQIVAGASATVTISAEGTTTLSYFAVDNAGNQEAAKTLTVRIDRTAPSFAGLPVTGCTLWPPDHRLVQVASVTAADGGAGVAGLTLAATSNEPETGTGDGDIAPDVIVTGGAVQLRAERAGNGAGRVYTITARATDQAGNVATETRTCVVPHDRGGH
jgi:hypothetical protein